MPVAVTYPIYTLTLTSYNPAICRHCCHKKINGWDKKYQLKFDLIGEFKEIIYPEGEVKIPAPDTKGNAG